LEAARVEGRDEALIALAEALLAHHEDALTVLRAIRDPNGEVVDFVHELVSTSAERNAGQPLLGRRQLEVYPVSAGSMFGAYVELLASGTVLHTEITVPAETPDKAIAGHTYEVYARPFGDDRVVSQYRDITELRAAQVALIEQALHDPLTGLANRRLLVDHLEQALARLARHPSVVALLFCDLDDFKTVNDTLGHSAGDELLQQVATRLRASVRPEDTVARIGGDEFVVLSQGLPDEADGEAVALRIRHAVSGSYRINAGEVDISISVGCAMTREVVPVDQLLSEADASLYLSKQAKRGRDNQS
jgi:diguanylate cyclase (GGDEF)-like protein